MGETRVNLKRLLEDIRDSYPLPLAEVILTELVANSLDSGASSIWCSTNASGRTFTIIDNGRGMREGELSTYHDIAATTKIRGKGIGFAGIGAKLALLVAQSVITETKMGSKHQATSWSLAGPMRAPWKKIKPPGWLKESSGTAVQITLPEKQSDGKELLHSPFIRNTFITHFLPLFDEELLKRLGRLYANRISFFLNEHPILPDPSQEVLPRRFFYVYVSKTKKPVGVGFLSASDQERAEPQQGIAISTYGKVIKRGWEWVGATPIRPGRINGIVEIPALAQILTTNKADFLKDQTSLKTYYRYRKAIQAAIEPILAELGEQPITPPLSSHRFLGSTDRIALQEVISEMLTEFPELEPLVGMRPGGDKERPSPLPETFPRMRLFDDNTASPETETLAEEKSQEGTDETRDPLALLLPKEDPPLARMAMNGMIESDPKAMKKSRQKSYLSIGFEEDPTRAALGWLSDETIWINKGHAAYRKAAEMGYERYHTVVVVGWVLASYVVGAIHAGNADIAGFLARYLDGWGRR
ncbi:MAG: ATP-binding protein [Nitrospirae bacterium]|nr:ATP-binding protein [Candidatus Troglogloeales bacterium]MBI3598222.1 ATP-binding protein [Candidatus Troglogloeales bacterium]